MTHDDSLFGIALQRAPDGWYEIVHEDDGPIIRIPDRQHALNACLAFAIAQIMMDEHPWLLHQIIGRLTKEQQLRDASYTTK